MLAFSSSMFWPRSQVVLVDPMLATGGSALAAIECLLEAGVDPARILFLNLVSCHAGSGGGSWHEGVAELHCRSLSATLEHQR